MMMYYTILCDEDEGAIQYTIISLGGVDRMDVSMNKLKISFVHMHLCALYFLSFQTKIKALMTTLMNFLTPK